MASEATDSKEKMATSLEANMLYMNKVIKADKNFDVIYRVIQVGGKNACIYLIDGFCKDEMMQKLLQHFMDITEETCPRTPMKCRRALCLTWKWILRIHGRKFFTA